MDALNMHLAYKFFEAAHMQRWNDHIRPVEFTELDKQAHKMVIAWVLASFQERERGEAVDWTQLIEGAMFSFLQRIVLTDLKPPVFHRIKREKGKELNQYVLREVQENIPGLDPEFLHRFQSYFEEQDTESVERRVLRAAHYLATKYEFNLVYAANPRMQGVEETMRNIEMQIEDHYDLIGVQRISLQKKSHGFIDFCGQLRFQQRWARSPRIPRTTVLGHMLMVANLSYLCALDQGFGPRRTCNNYFSALFHDLPEVLTKDIISPVKKSVVGLEDVLEGYERELVEEKLLPLLPSQWHRDFEYLLFHPFQDRVRENGRTEFQPDGLPLDTDEALDPVDGSIIKTCDLFAAYMEAETSIRYGISSKTLQHGRDDLRHIIEERSTDRLSFKSMMLAFDKMDI
ncbi:MAG: HD domain-containing protein [Candidatus Methanomethylophilaceae archaeon]|nr:HD domain-containing protein [Candidatus Methanomethylophilaceae archaeon]